MRHFKKWYWRGFVILASLVAGFHMLIRPEEVQMIVIRVVGFIWALEAVSEIIDWIVEKMEKDG